MGKSKIILVGGGGHCHSCIDVIEQESTYEIAGIVDRSAMVRQNKILGYPLLGSDDDLPEIRKEVGYAHITVGQIGAASARIRLYKLLKGLDFTLPAIISPLAYVSRFANIGEGTVVMHQAIVNAGADIGVNCILNTRCLIEHDAVIGDHTHVSTSAVVNGNAAVGSRCFLGSNVAVVNGAVIPDDYIFRAGSLILSENDGHLIIEGER